jgi:nucleoside-diphosphate-sugar epimerase
MRICDARQTFLGLWIRKALEGTPFDVWGGLQLRDFNYVDDVVEALLRMAIHPQAIGNIYNLGGDRVYSLRQTAETLTELTGTPHVIRTFPADRKAIDIGDYHASFEAIRRQLGWTPVTSLRDGLTAALAYFRTYAPLYQP